MLRKSGIEKFKWEEVKKEQGWGRRQIEGGRLKKKKNVEHKVKQRQCSYLENEFMKQGDGHSFKLKAKPNGWTVVSHKIWRNLTNKQTTRCAKG